MGSIKTQYYPEFVKYQVPELIDKTVAITGCTSGLGYVFAKTCILKNVKQIILLNRESERSKKVELELKSFVKSHQQTRIETVPCDLQDFGSVQRAVDLIQKDYTAIDVLCNNAGIMAFPDKATKDGYDIQMQTNHLSHFLLTKGLFSLLKQAKELRGEARIVNHSSFFRKFPPFSLGKKFLEKKRGSLGGNNYFALYQRYHQTKLANAIFTCELQRRLQGTGILARVAAPGYSTTNLFTGAPGALLFRWNVVKKLLAQSDEDGCMPLLAAAFLPSSEGMIWEPNGPFTSFGPTMEYPLESICTNEEDGRTLWETSEAACGEFPVQ